MSSFVENPSMGIDASVGTLIWIRRRNGAWWPAQIIGEDELPEGCVSMPRSGTPVKLLGREDASVDWYNLEKSKRVKPFRCDEYAGWIEKAKASAPSLSKNRAKYARREDAILQALELESAHLHNDHTDIACGQETPDEEQCNNVDESLSSHPSGEGSEDIVESLLSPELSQSGVSFEEPNPLDRVKEESDQWRTTNDSEDDLGEGIKRMKGLEDLGVSISSSPKRKRSVSYQVHDFSKRKNRRRTLTKVLESTEMVCSHVGSEDKVSGLESSESKNHSSILINNNSDSTGVSYENTMSMNLSRQRAIEDSLMSKIKDNEISSSMPVIIGHESSDDLFDVPLVSEQERSAGNADAQDISQVMEKGTSNWHLKGKRNSRLKKAETDEAEDKAKVTVTEENVLSRGSSHNTGSKDSECDLKSQDEMVLPRLLPCRMSRFIVNPKYDSSDFSLSQRTIGSGLYEVKIEVKSTTAVQNVPFTSLTSKLYHRPITGHRVSIEKLDDGYCDDLLSTSECYSSISELRYVSDLSNPHMGHEGKPLRTSAIKKKKNKKRNLRKLNTNVPSSKKIRNLSSLTKHSLAKKPLVEKLKVPSLACVPLKVVFSRINADLNSSMRPSSCLVEANGV